MSVIEELQSAVTDVAERVGPSIVGIGRGTEGRAPSSRTGPS